MSKSIIGSLKFKKTADGDFDVANFAQEIEDAYLSSRKTESFTQKKTFSPSTIGYGHGNCPRYWYIAFSGAEFNDTFTAQGLANMQNGTAAHDRIQKVLDKTGRLKDAEVEITCDDPPIRGFIDAVIEWEDKEVIAEIKTAKEEVYVIRQSSMKPSANHLLQLLIYMKLKETNSGFFIYENKNTQELCLIPVNMNSKNIKIIEDLFAWMKETYSVYEDGVLPKRSFTKSTQSCKGCPVKLECWSNLGDGEENVAAYVVPKL